MQIDIFNTYKKYKIIYADPPWRYNNKNCNGNCNKHYNTLTIKDICGLPIQKISDSDCILFIWSTYPMIKECLEVIDKWGFKYKTIGFQWIKTNKKNNDFFFGVGNYTRSNTECCLIAIKGKPKIINNSISQLIINPIMKHSEKPDIVRIKIIELIGDLPRIELFTRQQVDGWDCWGDEI